MPLKWFSLQSTTSTPVSFMVSYRAATSLNIFETSPHPRSNDASSASAVFFVDPTTGSSNLDPPPPMGAGEGPSSASTSTFFSIAIGPSVSGTLPTERVHRLAPRRCRASTPPRSLNDDGSAVASQTRRSETQTANIVVPPRRLHLLSGGGLPFPPRRGTDRILACPRELESPPRCEGEEKAGSQAGLDGANRADQKTCNRPLFGTLPRTNHGAGGKNEGNRPCHTTNFSLVLEPT